MDQLYIWSMEWITKGKIIGELEKKCNDKVQMIEMYSLLYNRLPIQIFAGSIIGPHLFNEKYI